MGQSRLQFIAMTLFVAGFVLAGSGWSLVITAKMQSRPDWSVCGQDMCACLPSTNIEPYCPLCITDDPDESACSGTQSTPTDTPHRIPKTARFEIASSASQAGFASIFLSFVFGSHNSTAQLPRTSISRVISQDDTPPDPFCDLPTPPPRA